MKVSSQYLGLALAIACLGILTEEAAANPAPLDTLMEYGAESEDLDP
jgi:hypothetical protein